MHSSSWNLWLLAIKTACIFEHNLYVYIVSNFMMMKYQLINTHLISFLWNYFLWNLMKLYIMIIAWYSMQFFIRILKFLLFNNIFVLNCYFYLVWGILLFHIFFLFMSLHNFFFSFHHISLKNSILLLILKQFFSNIIMFHIILIHNFIKPSLLLLSNLINQSNVML